MLDSKLLNVLKNLSQDDYKTASEIGNLTNTSEKTVRNRIKKINEKMESINSKIDSKKGFGYILKVEDQFEFQDFISVIDTDRIPNSNEDRVEYLLYLFLNTNNYIKIEELCEKLFISRNVLSSNLKQVEIILENYSMFFERRPNYGMKVKGSEFNKRIVLIKLFYDKYNIFDEDNISDDISDLVIRTNINFNVKMSEVTFDYFIKYIKIMIYRIQQGFLIVEENREEISQATQLIVEQLVTQLANNLEINLNKAEKNYLNIFYGASLSSDSYSNFGPNFVITSHINEIVYKMIDSVYETLSLDFRSNLELRISLNQHMVPMDIRMRYNILIQNPLLEQIKKEYSLAYTIATNATLPLNSIYKNKISEDEIGLIALIFALALEKNTRKAEKKNIIVVCATGRGSSQLFTFRFKKAFSKYINNIHECTPSDLMDFEFEKFEIDYIFTTIPLNTKVSLPIFEIDLFFSNSEIVEYSALFEEEDNSFISKYFKDFLFVDSLDVQSKDEVFNYLKAFTEERIDLPDDFYEAVLQREQLAQTDFGGMVAIPHPSKILTQDTYVVVAVLSKPIWWGHNYVQVVMMFSIGQNYDPDLEKFYDLISDFIFDTKRVNRLIANPTYENIVKILSSVKIPLS